jgi:hypothetical protein
MNFTEIRKNCIKNDINKLYETKQISFLKRNELLRLLTKTTVVGNEWRHSSLYKQLYK